MIEVRKVWAQGVVTFLMLTPLQIFAATAGKTNETALSYPPALIDLQEPLERSEQLKQRFLQEITTSDSIVFDRFTGPSSRLAWAWRQDTLGYQSIERWNNEGAHLFSTIAMDSLRTAATEALPLDLWEDDWEGRILNFIAGSVGNPIEERMDVTSISYSAVRSSWESMNEKGTVQWGLRPWRTSPYAYFFAHAGHLGGAPLFIFEGRAGYTLFGTTRLEARLTLRLPSSFRIAASGSTDPSKMGTQETRVTHFGVTLERVLGPANRPPVAVLFLGFRSGVNAMTSDPSRESLLIAGLSRSW